MQIGPWVLAGMLLGVGSMPLADATVLYPEETAAMREAWVRATSSVGQTKPPGGEALAPQAACRRFHTYTRGAPPR
jgi:hypothetical protein